MNEDKQEIWESKLLLNYVLLNFSNLFV